VRADEADGQEEGLFLLLDVAQRGDGHVRQRAVMEGVVRHVSAFVSRTFAGLLDLLFVPAIHDGLLAFLADQRLVFR